MNVLIVDDEPLARSRLIRLLAHDKSIVVRVVTRLPASMPDPAPLRIIAS